MDDPKKNREHLLKEIEELRRQLSLYSGSKAKLSEVEPNPAVLLDSLMLPVVIIAKDTHVGLYLNEFAEKFFNISRVDALGEEAPDYWVDKDLRQKYLHKIEKEGQVVDFEAEILTSDKVHKQVLLSAREVLYQDRPAIYAIIKDITDRKKIEKALLESEARYQGMYNMMKLMANTLPDMIWAKDLDDSFLFANKAIRDKLLKCKKEETPIGKTDLFFADRERAAGYLHTFGEICVNSDKVVKESLTRGRFLEDGMVRGKYLALDVHKAPLFNEDGTLLGTVGAGRDVTKDIATQQALEESEKRFRLLAENVRDVLWVADVDFTPTYVTPSITKLGGYSQAEFLALPFEKHMTPRYKRKYTAVRRLIQSSGKNKKNLPAKFFEFECFRKDGSKIWVEIITTAMWDKAGELLGFTGVIRDSTKRIQEHHELKHAEKQAQAASQTKSEFLANMSHEIRTPMNGVLGILQLLNETPLTETQKKYVDTALSSGKSLLKIISDILDFSKIEAGKVELEHAVFDLINMIDSVVDSFKNLVDTSKVKLRYTIEDDVPRYVSADESRIRQILFNLVGNAVKFTSEGSVELLVKAGEGETEKELVLYFEINDSGSGISSSMIRRLFEPFAQEDSSFRRKYGGTGLGLSIVKNLVELMGGSIVLESNPDEGTRALFNIRALKEDAPEPFREKTDIETFSQLMPMKMLIVEDESINAMVISAMLKKLGHEVELAKDGMQALDILKTQTFDCVFMDIQLPEMDGIETTKAIRGDSSGINVKIPIIALTAHAMKGDRELFLEAGMNDYLSKPVELENLFGVLNRLASKTKN